MTHPGFSDLGPQTAMPNPHERFTPEEVRLGDVLNRFINEESNTGNHNTPSYISGKLPYDSIPGLRDTLEWQTVIPDTSTGQFTDGTYPGRVPAFGDIAAIGQAIKPEALSRQTSYVTLQTLRNGLAAVSYNTWSDARYINDHVKAPSDLQLGFNFTIREDKLSYLIEKLHMSPEMLEVALQRSPYGRLLWSQGGGPIVRNQAMELMIVDLSRENTSAPGWHRAIGSKMMRREYPVAPYQVPVGDTDRRAG